MSDQSDLLYIKFEGTNLEKGTIDAYDLAVTVMATADTLRGIANHLPHTKNSDLRIDVSALRPGSFDVNMTVSLKELTDLGLACIPLLNGPTVNTIKDIVDVFKHLVSVKKFLKGEKPNKVEINQNGTAPVAVIYNIQGDNMTVNMPTFNMLQDKQINGTLKKVFEPMLKAGGDVDNIQIARPDSNDEEKVNVAKEEATFFDKIEELQTVPLYRIRGVVTAMDRKTTNGKLTVGDNKRANFEIDIDDISKLDKVMDGLIDSMRGKIPVIVIGEAVLDLEANLRKIKIKDLEQDSQLF